MSGREEVHLSMEVPPSMAHDPWEEAFVSDADTNAEETLNTLKPANQAHEIQIIDVELIECYLSMIQNQENEVRQLEAALRTTGEESREVEEDKKVTKQTCLQDAMGKQSQELEQKEKEMGRFKAGLERMKAELERILEGSDGCTQKKQEGYIKKLKTFETWILELKKSQENEAHLWKKKQRRDETAKIRQDKIRQTKPPQVQLKNKMNEQPEQFPSGKAYCEKDILQGKCFRELKMIPRPNELLVENFVHPNRVYGPYPNMYTYLSTQYLLLREDFLGSYRKSLTEVREYYDCIEQGRGHALLNTCRIFNCCYKFLRKTNEHIVSFNQDVHGQSDRDKVLMNNSLLCISYNKFRTFQWGIVHKTCDHTKMEVCIASLDCYELSIASEKDFIMFESKRAYLEAYQHVLEVLQKPEMMNITFKKQLVQLNTKIPGIEYNISKQEFCNDHIADDSQKKAIKYCVKKKLAIIQGPPGTGKTFTALQIVRELLHRKASDYPILIVSLSNRALNKFLEGVYNFEENIARLGGKSDHPLHSELTSKGCLERTFKVVGMTTTYAAKNHQDVANLKCEIIIVEEAGQVLEGQILACLNPKMHHMILIGDHQQLQPPVGSLLGYNMEISMIERLVNNGMKYKTLNVQRRMRPTISNYIRYFYPTLTDHQSVLGFEDVRGVNKNVLFIDHNYPLDNSKTSSRSNPMEGEIVVQFYLYLTNCCGYMPNDVTIITTYRAQINVINKKISSFLDRNERVRITKNESFPRVKTIDEFQGEESNIILLSLVTNRDSSLTKEHRGIGFIQNPNRICVALSRARFGMFVFGSSSILSKHSHVWRDIIASVKKNGCLDEGISLCCPKNIHHVQVVAYSAGDLKKHIQSVCKTNCNIKLDCGHYCPNQCHFGEHEHIQCEVRCMKKLDGCGHICNKICHTISDCLPCLECPSSNNDYSDT